MQWRIAAKDKVCKVPCRYEEEFDALEGVLIRREGALFVKQLPELAQVNPWEWYTSFKFRALRLHLPDDQ